MTQAERDRPVALKKARKKLITQKEAAEEIGVTERQVRRLLRKLRRMGDKAVIHALRGNRPTGGCQRQPKSKRFRFCGIRFTRDSGRHWRWSICERNMG